MHTKVLVVYDEVIAGIRDEAYRTLTVRVTDLLSAS